VHYCDFSDSARGELGCALQRQNTENSKHIFPEKKLRGHSPNSYIHVSVSDLYIPLIGLPMLLQEIRWTERGNILIAHRHMNMEIGFFFYELYSTLLHLPPLIFHCVRGCWNRTEDCCDFGIGSQPL
jgi:hypothetical protein